MDLTIIILTLFGFAVTECPIDGFFHQTTQFNIEKLTKVESCMILKNDY